MNAGRETPLPIIILSGGTGRTAECVLNAALAQFDHPRVKVIRKVNVRRSRDALNAVKLAAETGAVLCHTLVAPKVREAVNGQVLRLNVPAVDLLGPALSLLADHLRAEPRGRAGLLYELCKEQFDRSDAVDFTLAHDDGLHLQDLHRADVVLVGVSRVSKSVTGFYLASRGIRAANVPITPIHDIPPELMQLDHRRVIGLTMNASRLSAIRRARLDQSSHRPVPGYAEQREVAAELNRAAEIMRRRRWRCIDVSYRATEDIASEVIRMLPNS